MGRKDVQWYMDLPYSIVIRKRYNPVTKKSYYWASVLELPFCSIHGDTREEALRDIEKVKEDWIKECIDDGTPIPEPETTYSGNYHLRMRPELHEELAQRAKIWGVSLNQAINRVLNREVYKWPVEYEPTAVFTPKKIQKLKTKNQKSKTI